MTNSIHPELEPDEQQLAQFVEIIFRHAGSNGYVTLRSFEENVDKVHRIAAVPLTEGLPELIRKAAIQARGAARFGRPIVFAPPLAIFNNAQHARAEDILAGLVLSVECDQHPTQARAQLEQTLGPATLVVRSGGQWVNGNAVPEAKLHLHWRLAMPATSEADLAALKQARELATRLVGGDASNTPVCHPMRWPGSWHRKAEPKLCAIETANPEQEIDLAAALAALREAAGGNVSDGASEPYSQSSYESEEGVPHWFDAAVAALKNNNLPWDAWNARGMSIWFANNSEQGWNAFDAFSQKSSKYNAQRTRERWQHYFKSPPTKITAGKLHYLADQDEPGWRNRFEESTITDEARAIDAWLAASGIDAMIEAAHAKQRARPETATRSTAARLLQSSAEFVAGFVPPDYQIDGLLQRRYIYSMTAPTGAGKTAITMRIAAHVALGFELAGREVEQGSVLYFAGENPDDVRTRWIKLCEELGQNPDIMDVVFLPGTPIISNKEIRKRIDAEAAEHGPFSLVIIDTSAAYFTGEDENSNAQLAAHARTLRSFVNLPGGPTILVTCHPVKNFDMNNLLPRGGGAFLNEVDGNLVCLKESDSNVVTLDTHGKFRGAEFEPFSFKLIAGTSEKLKDTKGRLVSTVTAEPITQEDKSVLEDIGRDRQDQLLLLMKNSASLSLAEMAEELGWFLKDGSPYKSMVQRILTRLTKDRLVTKNRDHYELTKRGIEAATAIEASRSTPHPAQALFDKLAERK